MSDRTEIPPPEPCAHEFESAPIDSHRFAKICRCGETRPCERWELQQYLRHCISIYTHYVVERDKARSKESEKAFQNGIDLKRQQISWLKSQLWEEV